MASSAAKGILSKWPNQLFLLLAMFRRFLRLPFAILLCPLLAIIPQIQCQNNNLAVAQQFPPNQQHQQYPLWIHRGHQQQEGGAPSNPHHHSHSPVPSADSPHAPSQQSFHPPAFNWPQNAAAATGFFVAHPQHESPSRQLFQWPDSRPRKGLSRLLEEFGGRKGEDEEMEEEGREDGEDHLWHQTANGGGPQLSPDMNRPPLSTNLERYMPLLAKHRPMATKMTRNATARTGALGGGGGSRKGKNGAGGGGGGGHHLIDSREMFPPVAVGASHSAYRAGGGPEEAEDEEEEDESMEATNAAAGTGANIPADQLGPCVTANCRTWITITIPSELVGIPPGIGLPGTNGGGGGGELTGGRPQQKPDGNGVKGGKITSGSSSKSMPPFPPQPMPQSSKSRGLPSAKNRPTPAPAKPLASLLGSSTPAAATTTRIPPDFVFSTKWILPVNGVSLRPNALGNISAASSPSPSSSSSFSSSTPSAPITTATAGGSGNAGVANGAGNPWGQRPPFTIRPKVPSPSSSAGPPPSPLPLPRERPPSSVIKTGPRPKPWTHSSSSSSSSNSKIPPKARPLGPSPSVELGGPRPPTPDTTIEQAAIWASTELIDAIREALAKFRATLNRNGRAAAAQADEYGGHGHGEMGATASEAGEMMDPEQAERELQAQLKAAWDTLRGTWLEQAVAELAQQADALGGHQAGTKLAEMFLPKAEEEGRGLRENHRLGMNGGGQRRIAAGQWTNGRP